MLYTSISRNHTTMDSFQPAQNQRRWVRDRNAFIRSEGGQWFHFVRVDQVVEHMVCAPYDHDDAGRWASSVQSYWRSDVMGVSFPSIRDAVQWVEEIARRSRIAQMVANR